MYEINKTYETPKGLIKILSRTKKQKLPNGKPNILGLSFSLLKLVQSLMFRLATLKQESLKTLWNLRSMV